jgi:6-phosphogluconolactonase (cycloisomerase 2 family)
MSIRGDLVFIGGYTADTGGSGPGITVCHRLADGGLARLGEAAVPGPSFLAAHPRQPVLYAVEEREEGGLAAFGVSPDGALHRMARRPSGGSEPCHLAVDPSGTWVAVTNYGDGVLGMHRVDSSGLFVGEALLFPGKGGGPDPERQAGPHAHQAVFGPDGVLYVSDLGADEIRRYVVGGDCREHPEGPVRLAAGMGPRHMAYHEGHWYVTGELDGTVRTYDAMWRPVGEVSAGGAGAANAPSHIAVSADGRHVYVGNRGPDTISVFERAGMRRVTEVPAGGSWPRHFAVSGGHMYVADQRSDVVAVLALRDGVPAPTGRDLAVGTPSCVLPIA